jgi:hypothetical protein
MSTYREELCNKDERGIPLFSPLCKPGRTVDTKLSSQVVRSTWGSLNCYIPPVPYPSASVNSSQVSDADSARDWFKDPTYAQTVAMRSQGLDYDRVKVHDALERYHINKAMQKAGVALMETL